MPESMRDDVHGNIELSSYGSPRVPGNVGSERREGRNEGAGRRIGGANFLQSLIHLHEERAVGLASLAPRNEQLPTLPFFNDGTSLRLHLDIVHASRFGATINEAVGASRKSRNRKEVYEIHADQAERQLEASHVLLLPRFHRKGKEGTEHLHGHRTLHGSLVFYFEATERIRRRDAVIDGIIEHSPEITQVDGSAVCMRATIIHEPAVETNKPVLGDSFETQRGRVRIKSLHLPQGGRVKLTGALCPALGDIVLEARHHQLRTVDLGRQNSLDLLLHFGEGQAKEITRGRETKKEIVHRGLPFHEVGVYSLTIGETDNTLSLGVPLGRKDTHTEGKQSCLRVMIQH